jgi:hypothetical protein
MSSCYSEEGSCKLLLSPAVPEKKVNQRESDTVLPFDFPPAGRAHQCRANVVLHTDCEVMEHMWCEESPLGDKP